jgi:hypothetical protein
METIIVNPDQQDPRYIMNDIIREHSVEKFKEFISKHPVEFKELTEEQKQDDGYLFDVLHLFKAMLPYCGEEHVKSYQYCIDKGIIVKPGSTACGVNANTPEE